MNRIKSSLYTYIFWEKKIPFSRHRFSPKRGKGRIPKLDAVEAIVPLELEMGLGVCSTHFPTVLLVDSGGGFLSLHFQANKCPIHLPFPLELYLKHSGSQLQGNPSN